MSASIKQSQPQRLKLHSSFALRDRAARLAAACEKSDPHVYSRMMAHFRSGHDFPSDSVAHSCARLGITNSPQAIAQFLAREMF
jgi:hypothetical protein